MCIYIYVLVCDRVWVLNIYIYKYLDSVCCVLLSQLLKLWLVAMNAYLLEPLISVLINVMLHYILAQVSILDFKKPSHPHLEVQIQMYFCYSSLCSFLFPLSYTSR